MKIIIGSSKQHGTYGLAHYSTTTHIINTNGTVKDNTEEQNRIDTNNLVGKKLTRIISTDHLTQRKTSKQKAKPPKI